MKLPDYFVPKEKIITINDPGIIIKISAKFNLKHKTVIYNSSETSNKKEKESKCFRDLSMKIQNVLNQKKEIQNLKKTSAPYY